MDHAGRLVLDLRGYGLRVRVWVRIRVRKGSGYREARRRRLDLRDPHREPHALHLAVALGADGVERAALMALKAPKRAVDLCAFGS